MVSNYSSLIGGRSQPELSSTLSLWILVLEQARPAVVWRPRQRHFDAKTKQDQIILLGFGE